MKDVGFSDGCTQLVYKDTHSHTSLSKPLQKHTYAYISLLSELVRVFMLVLPLQRIFQSTILANVKFEEAVCSAVLIKKT